MRLTIVHPCIGRRPGERYIKAWQMEPLPPATLAGLTPPGWDVRFYNSGNTNQVGTTYVLCASP